MRDVAHVMLTCHVMLAIRSNSPVEIILMNISTNNLYIFMGEIIILYVRNELHSLFSLGYVLCFR